MGKTVSVIVYIKVSVFSLVFGCLCCVCVSFVVVVVAVHCFCLFCFGFFFIVSGLLFFWLCCCSSQFVSSKKRKVYWGSAHHEGPEVRKGALVVGVEMDGGACAPTSKCEYIFLLFFNGFLREIFCCRRWGKKILNLYLLFSPEKTDWADQAFERAPLQSVVTKVRRCR